LRICVFVCSSRPGSIVSSGMVVPVDSVPASDLP
jgi:hypothetical protein